MDRVTILSMAFREAGRSRNFTPNTGLPVEWKNLLQNACPSCREELVYFDRIDLWKCACGFKISGDRFDSLTDKLSDDDEDRGFSSGYRYGDYYGEPPF